MRAIGFDARRGASTPTTLTLTVGAIYNAWGLSLKRANRLKDAMEVYKYTVKVSAPWDDMDLLKNNIQVSCAFESTSYMYVFPWLLMRHPPRQNCRNAILSGGAEHQG